VPTLGADPSGALRATGGNDLVPAKLAHGLAVAFAEALPLQMLAPWLAVS
jgi:hypothetical protein